MSYTKGPWRVKQYSPSNGFCIVAESGDGVLWVSEWIDAKKQDIRLMAAAPELLEALEEILEDYTLASEEWVDDARIYAEELIPKVAKVITKAKGE